LYSIRCMRKNCDWAHPLRLDGVRLRSQASHQAFTILNPSKGSLQLNLRTTGIVPLYPAMISDLGYDWTAFLFLHEGGLFKRHWLGVVVHLDRHHSTALELFFKKYGQTLLCGVVVVVLGLCVWRCAGAGYQ
jgi:hypothetical protein